MARSKGKKARKNPVRIARQARSKATVDTIIEAATRILAEAGWPALNTNAIAVRAGVSVGSVYEYFPNKHAIIDVIIDHHLEAAEALLADAAGEIKGLIAPDRVVEVLVIGFIRLHSDNPRLHRALSSEVPISTAQRARVEALRDKIVTLVALALDPHTEEAWLKSALLVDTADSLAHRWLVDEVGLPLSADQMAAEAIKMLKGYVEA